MKRRKPQGTPRKAAPQHAKSTVAASHRASISPARRWLYRAAALVLVPLFLLTCLEVALRLAEFGYPTTFFLKTRVGDQEQLVTNEQFGRRFFPRGLERSPTPYAFAAAKPTNTFRIFLFGESAALGDPRPAYGFGRYLEVLLRERFPQTRFEVICWAMTAINSHGLRLMAHEAADCDADLWVIYMGNNEMEGPFGASTIFGPQAPSLAFVRASLALKATRTGQLLEQLSWKLRSSTNSPAAWKGMQMFLENPLSPGDPAKEVVYSHFRRNLADMIECGLDSGAGVVVCSVASNLKDFPPLASLHGPAFEITRTNHWAELVNRGREHQAAGRIPEAQASYREAEAMDPLFALLQFQLGQCALALTNEADAARCFTAARDLDALPFRTDSRLNAIVREAAQRFASRGVVFVDSEAALQTAGTGGIPGDEWFFDHVHFRFDGNDRLARTLAEVIEPLLPAEITRGRSGAWASQVDCENRIGLTDWNRVRVLESVVRRLQEPPFTGQPNHAEQIRRLFEQLLAIRVELHPRRYLETEDVYTQALKREADDPRLRESFAEFLETSGQLERAESEWEQVCRLLPQHTIAWYQRGRVLGLLRRWEAAEQCLATALQLRPDFGEAQLELGQVYRQQNRPEAALAEYRAVQSRHPENARVLVMLADLLAAQGKREEAFDLLREAVRRQPTYWEARYLLGVEYAVKEQVAEAEREFQEVVRLRPDHVLARLNLGIAQVRLNRFAEARRQFEKVLEVDPENQRAKQHLASLSAMLAPAP